MLRCAAVVAGVIFFAACGTGEVPSQCDPRGHWVLVGETGDSSCSAVIRGTDVDVMISDAGELQIGDAGSPCTTSLDAATCVLHAACLSAIASVDFDLTFVQSRAAGTVEVTTNDCALTADVSGQRK